MNAIYAIAYVKKPEKIRYFNGLCTHDLEMPVRCSNQLSYEVTDIGSRLIEGSYVPVEEMSLNDV